MKKEKQTLKGNKILLQTVTIIIQGRVQGVFFRKYTLDAAKKFEVNGFVKNTADSNVYIEATGTEEAINKFIHWCHIGSPLSKVVEVTVKQTPLINFNDFTVR